jgi:Flp pilus assembly protein TadG
MNATVLRQQLGATLKDQQGAVAVMVAVFLVVLAGMTALVLDIGHALVARNQLQNASDAAALAGARALGVIYGGMSGSLTGYTLTAGEVASISNMATLAGADNQAAGVTVAVNAADISVGIWDSSTRTFTPTTVLPTAVRVTTRRDGAANGPISTMLASMIGTSSVSVTAVATAQLNPVGTMAPGEMDVPFGLSQLAASQGCGAIIQFAPNVPGNPLTCAGWQAFDISPPSANAINGIVDGMIAGTYTPPSAQAGVTSFNFTNGNRGSTWDALVTLWQMKVAQEGAWNVQVPVYLGDDCSPTGAQLIIGFATMKITYVGHPGDANNAVNCVGTNPGTGCMTGSIQCNVFEGLGSGGAPFGTFGTIPGLVE